MSFERSSYSSIILSIIGDYLDANLNRVLTPLGKAIAESGAQIEEIASRYESPGTDSWIDDEVEIMEELLGVAFVACQVFITLIATNIMRLHNHATDKRSSLTTVAGISNMKSGEQKVAIMRYGHAAKDAYSTVEVINACANYYKHSDEWGLKGIDWADPPKREGETIKVIQFAGAEQGSTGNLRTGAEHLGNPVYDDLSVFVTHVGKWRKSLVDAYRAELIEKGLITLEIQRKRRKKTTTKGKVV